MDAPIHFQSHTIDGQPMMTIDQVPLDWFFRPGVKLDFRKVPDGHVVTAAEVEAELKRIGHELKPFDIVLVNTRASECIGSEEYLTAGCGMGREATLYLTSRGVRVAGIDAWGWDVPFVHMRKRWLETRDPSIIWEGHKAAADSILPHGEAVQSGKAARRRFHGSVLSVEAEKRLGRLDAGGGDVRLAAFSNPAFAPGRIERGGADHDAEHTRERRHLGKRQYRAVGEQAVGLSEHRAGEILHEDADAGCGAGKFRIGFERAGLRMAARCPARKTGKNRA